LEEMHQQSVSMWRQTFRAGCNDIGHGQPPVLCAVSKGICSNYAPIIPWHPPWSCKHSLTYYADQIFFIVNIIIIPGGKEFV
jgi:hypothetical protein